MCLNGKGSSDSNLNSKRVSGIKFLLTSYRKCLWPVLVTRRMKPAIGSIGCDTCLVMLRAGLRSRENKVEWERTYDFHLTSVHGIRPAARVEAPSAREQLQEFWRTFRLPEKPMAKERFRHIRR